MAKDLIAHVRQAIAPIAGREGGDWTLEYLPMLDAIEIRERLRGFLFQVSALDIMEGDQWLNRLRSTLEAWCATKAASPTAPQSPTEPSPGRDG